MTASSKRRLITAEHERMLVLEWNNLTLYAVMAENSGKPRKFCLVCLVSCMHRL